MTSTTPSRLDTVALRQRRHLWRDLAFLCSILLASAGTLAALASACGTLVGGAP